MHKAIRHFWRIACLLVIGVVLGLGIVAYLHQQRYASYLPRNTQIGPVLLSNSVKRTELAQVLRAKTAQHRLTLQLSESTLHYPLADTGVSYNIDAAVQQANARAKHFFALDLLRKPAPIVLPVRVDETKLALFAQKVTSDHSAQLVRAKFSISGSAVSVQPGKAAVQYNPQELAAAIQSRVKAGALTVKHAPQAPAPPNTAAQLAQAQTTLQAMLGAPATITVGTRSFTTTATERFGWITAEESATGDFKFIIDTAKVTAYVKTVAAALYRAPTTTTITLHDDAESARQAGAAGASLPIDSTVAQIRQRLEAARPEAIAVTLAPVAPPVRYVRTYSRSATGMGLLIRDFIAEHRSTFGVVLDDLSGSLDASRNADTRFVTASIFKTFLAYAILNKVDSGEYTMGTVTPGGTTVQTAIDKMIKVSDNQTAYELHQLYGFTNIYPFLHSHGYGSTILNNYNASGKVISDKTTTPRDTATLLARLHAGSLLSTGSSNYLLNLLKTQIYRAGIPAGSAPSPVADKVGFLGAYIHDAGIVYSPRGTYVLVVLTKGGTWADIADLSRRIHALYTGP
jgi:beta-lactamase class A